MKVLSIAPNLSPFLESIFPCPHQTATAAFILLRLFRPLRLCSSPLRARGQCLYPWNLGHFSLELAKVLGN